MPDKVIIQWQNENGTFSHTTDKTGHELVGHLAAVGEDCEVKEVEQKDA